MLSLLFIYFNLRTPGAYIQHTCIRMLQISPHVAYAKGAVVWFFHEADSIYESEFFVVEGF